MSSISLRFALALWFGGGLAVLFGTRAIFRSAQTRREGGISSGALLASFFWVRLLALALTGAGWASGPGAPRYWAVAAVALTLVHAPLDARIRAFRDQLHGSTGDFAADEARRRRWGVLHGASVLLLFAQIVCGGAGLALAQ